jgi:lipid A 4'-phosphatase
MKGFAIYGAALGLSIALFLLLPGIDLAVSRLFYNPQHGFTLAASWPLRFVDAAVPWITWAVLGIVALAALWLRLTGRPIWRLDCNALIFLVAALAIGPGIVTNTVLKDHWGRARPFQIEAFGGTRQFTPAPLRADQCDHNCSFVSGHAALGFSLIAFALLLPPGRRRNQAIGATIGFGALLGLARIMAGHHFLSDIVYAGLIVVATTWLLYFWLVVHDGATPVIAFIDRLSETQQGRRALWLISFVLFEAVSMIWIDRPLADFFHAKATAVKPFFEMVQRFGIGYPYMVLSGLAYVALRWGDRWGKLRARGPTMHAAAVIPGFFFAAVGASGLLVDLLKVIIGRTRPKLLFAGGAYDFGWFGLRADDWSFPSGHAATATAVMTALWCLWPRPLALYVAAAALVAMSRVVTGAHYLSDVVAGAAIAVVVTRLIAYWLVPRRAIAKMTEHDAAPHYRAV